MIGLDVVTLPAPGASAIAAAATAAQALGNFDLSNRLNDLSISLTHLAQELGSTVFKSQALAGLDSILSLMAVSPLLVGFGSPLAAARDQLAAAANDGATLAALGILSHVGPTWVFG